MRPYRFDAMGTEVHVLLSSERRDAITAVRELFIEWEARLSRFLPESELSHLNARAGEAVVVSPLVFDVVAASIEAARASDGVFDPTLLRQLVRIGYARSFEHVHPASCNARENPLPGGGWRNVELDRHSRLVTLPAGSGLDLGGIAKGMAVDAGLALLRRRAVEAALVSAGGDLAVLGHPPGARAWAVLVGGDPEGDVVQLAGGGLATSGIARRTWLQGGARRHHLVDPRTGEPAEGDLQEVTVAAGSCKVAEVAATVSFVLGSQRGADFISARGLAGRLTRTDGTYVTVGAWPTRLRGVA
jgi:thiamine biosynthesis lipoprotein